MAPSKPAPAPKPPTMQQQLDELNKRVNQQNLELERVRKKSLAENTLQMFEHTVFGRAEKWMVTARNIGSAYVRAAKAHRDALGGENENRALQKQAMFSILTVLSAGSLTWVWEANNFVRVGKLLGPILKDSIATGLGEVFDNGVSLAPVSPMRDAVSQEPQEFQNELENRVSAFVTGAHTFMFDVWKYIRSAPTESWDQVQVGRVQKMTDVWLQEAVKVGNLSATSDEERTKAQMADEIERGFWRTWIFGLVTSTQDSNDSSPVVRREYEAIHTGGPVEARLKTLGILREAGVTIARYHEAIEEDRPLIAWARDKYKPHPFTAE